MVTHQDTSAEKDQDSLQGRQAEELFPDFFQKTARKEYEGPAVPQPPGDSWLESDAADGREESSGLHALLLVQDREQVLHMGMALQRMGYTTAAVQSAEHALDELKSATYQLIVCGTEAAYSTFRDYLSRSLPQQRRRLLYYVLVGPDVHTCYNLQALALSANLVINERELPYFETILNKGLQDYTELFGPFLEVLGETRSPALP
ncbi:MAG: hypothetical protein Q4G66_02850 [bacterium]|nr:hypothetical protein [bacterium]